MSLAVSSERVRFLELQSIGWIMKKPSLTATILGMGLAFPPLSDMRASELEILAGGAMTAALGELGPQFERASGHKVIIHFAATPELIKQVTTGTPFDLGVVTVDVMKDAAARARFVSGPTTNIARVGFGVAVRTGTPKPDVSSPDALKQTLIKAQSITFLPESAAGAYVLSVFERLGISAAMKIKTKPQTVPAQIAQAVAKGEAELGVFLVNVLMAPGVELAGPFPAELQQDLMFVAAVAADTKAEEVAKAFIRFLTTPAATGVIKAKGMTPG